MARLIIFHKQRATEAALLRAVRRLVDVDLLGSIPGEVSMLPALRRGRIVPPPTGPGQLLATLTTEVPKCCIQTHSSLSSD